MFIEIYVLLYAGKDHYTCQENRLGVGGEVRWEVLLSPPSASSAALVTSLRQASETSCKFDYLLNINKADH